MSAYLEHLTLDGDRLDLLAWTYYGDVARVAPILQANPGLFSPMLPTVLPSGLTLKIPILEEADATSSEGVPPWLR